MGPNGMSVEGIKRIIEKCQGITVEVPLRNLHPGGLARPPLYGTEKQFSWIRETRFINGERREVVLLDSVESQANRLELLLRKHVPALPDIKARFPNGFEVSVYEAPHRIFDAIFRECTLDGKPFHEHEIIKEIEKGGADAEKTLFKHAPLVLLFGGWHSHGSISPEKAPKWPRLITLEIVGTEPEAAHRTSSRRDPLGIPREGLPEELKKSLEEQGKRGTAAEAGLGMLPPAASPLDVVVKEAYLLGAISLVGIRNLTFPMEAKAVLLSLALLGLALQHEGGYRLRSGADFVGESPLKVGLLGCREHEQELTLNADECKRVLDEALGKLGELVKAPEGDEGLEWPQDPLVLYPTDPLKLAHEAALQGKQEKNKKKAGKGKVDQVSEPSEEG